MSISQSTVETLLRLQDIEGLIESGAPDNEYDSEAEEITTAVNELNQDQITEENIISIITLIWAESFNRSDNEMRLRLPVIRQTAQRILETTR